MVVHWYIIHQAGSGIHWINAGLPGYLFLIHCSPLFRHKCLGWVNVCHCHIILIQMSDIVATGITVTGPPLGISLTQTSGPLSDQALFQILPQQSVAAGVGSRTIITQPPVGSDAESQHVPGSQMRCHCVIVIQITGSPAAGQVVVTATASKESGIIPGKGIVAQKCLVGGKIHAIVSGPGQESST